MHRYLLNISYIGTNFRGIQKTINKLEEARLDTNSIQGCLELALRVFRPKNEIQTVLSSRTDAGVHALHSTVHVDLERSDGKPYDTSTLTGVLNRTLDKHKLPIRILSSQRVVDTFHCRYHATGRTYLYRVAVAKSVSEASKGSSLKNKGYESFVPVEEIDRCYFLHCDNFDVERLHGAARMFLGLHDFRTFMSVSRQKSPSRDHPMFTVRKIDEINIRPGQTLALGPNAKLATQTYDYWDIEIKAKSFLYKQVRRIVGTLLALANSRIDERCIYQMLTIPSKHNWDSRVVVAPACGLYLCRVHYRETAFDLPEEISQ
ncbi:tRNA pseudouridine synthase-like 1 [Drosophila grimshawi]|uniref:tRNA pseudouridine synthase n=1 Tax=Drosophila grimshawi TaxID=7222 RepID=B4J2A3_DROGR|nr:tRNA pseudouridine synthase-like 1 [Drosophila grimshawi]EDV95962.1 GH25313, isoform B [Drosophila grimshawi]